MPYDGAESITHPTVSPTRSLYRGLLTYSAGSFSGATPGIALGGTTRIAVNLRWSLASADVGLALPVVLLMSPGGVSANGDYYTVLDSFVVYASDAYRVFWAQTPNPLTNTSTIQAVRTEQYAVAGTGLVVAINSSLYPSLPTPAGAGNVLVSVVELGF